MLGHYGLKSWNLMYAQNQFFLSIGAFFDVTKKLQKKSLGLKYPKYFGFVIFGFI